jgi:hypothetical protein
MLRAVAAATVSVVALAGCSAAPPATTAPAPSREPEPVAASASPAPRSGLPTPVTATVTADQLGARSMIAVVTNVRDRGGPETGLATSLEVITPDGVRHPVWSVALAADESSTYPGDVTLADWRPDLHTALVQVQRRGFVPDRVVAYDVTTGETHAMVLPKAAYAAGLQPDGTGILLGLYETGPHGALVARDWDGTTTRLPADTGGAPLTSVDGRTLVTPARGRPAWWVVDLAQRGRVELDLPGFCDPIRWLGPDRILAGCYARGGNRLWSVGLDGRSTIVGPFHRVDPGRVDVISDGDVLVVGASRWFVTWRNHGRGVLTVQAPSAARTRVRGTGGLVHLAPAGQGQLLLGRSDSALELPSMRAVLERYDPVSGTTEVLVRLEPGQTWRELIGATEVRPWSP